MNEGNVSLHSLSQALVTTFLEALQSPSSVYKSNIVERIQEQYLHECHTKTERYLMGRYRDISDYIIFTFTRKVELK